MQNDLVAILFLLFSIVIYFCASAYGIAKCRMNNLTKESGKPIIRHCVNCEHSSLIISEFDTPKCNVKYKYCFDPRRKALFCRYYKEKEGGKNDES